MTEVHVVRIGDGIGMPMVGFGTWQLSGRQAYDAVRFALETGYRHIDTATMYGNETEVGRALRDSGVDRRDVFITTKLPPGRAGQERATLSESLRGLGTDYVDLWLIHWPPRRGSQSVPVWREFLTARSEGLCRAVGVSNYSPKEIDELSAATGQTPAVDQVPWSPTGHNPDLLAALRERGVVVEGYSPLKGHPVAGPCAARDRGRAWRDPGSGGAALAHSAWHHRDPQVLSARADRVEFRSVRFLADR